MADQVYYDGFVSGEGCADAAMAGSAEMLPPGRNAVGGKLCGRCHGKASAGSGEIVPSLGRAVYGQDHCTFFAMPGTIIPSMSQRQ